jgi:hypothetical protein
MRITEIIRALLDRIDQLEQDQERDQADANRSEQIRDLRQDQPYTTEPQEQYADINAVTINAGGGWQGPKDVKDLRGTTTRIYGDN